MKSCPVCPNGGRMELVDGEWVCRSMAHPIKVSMGESLGDYWEQHMAQRPDLTTHLVSNWAQLTDPSLTKGA